MIDQKCKLTFHHTGCLTANIENSKQIYSAMGFSSFSQVYIIVDQKVKVCFIEMATGVFLELVEPFEDNLSLNKLLKSKSSFYHLGYLTDEFENTLEDLQTAGFYLINKFRSEAFANKYCAFLFTSEMHLIEIIES